MYLILNSSTSATADALIGELFELNGTGTLTAYLSLDADWDIAGNSWNIFSYVCVYCNTGLADIDSFQGVQNSNSFEDLLLVASSLFSNVSSIMVNIEWYILASLTGSSLGFIDLLNTATIFVETTETLVAEASDSLFLSNAAFGSEIPLPAALPLFLSALGAMGFLGWLRKKSAAI